MAKKDEKEKNQDQKEQEVKKEKVEITKEQVKQEEPENFEAINGANVQQPATPKNIQIPGFEGLLGGVSWLLLHSAAHKHLFVTDYEWLIIPPLMLKQFRIFRRKNMPFAYISWARINEETENRLLSGISKLSPKDWNSGDRLWIIDCIAPFGGGFGVLRELQERVFKDENPKMLQPKKDGKGVEAKLLKDFLLENAPKKKEEEK